ncbi:polyphosphate kinase 2 family protein [soil metagenome]
MPYAVRVKPGTRVDLSRIEPRQDGGLEKAVAKGRVDELAKELDDLQDMLYAAGDHSLLIVLQGMDTSGKDGTIKSVFRYVQPLGCRSWSFKMPTELELKHDFLWRVHQKAPELGIMTIFNRSHYEDVLVVRVKNLAPVDVWRARFEQINAFERLLADNGTIVLKFFLHISKEEQEERLLDREKEVDKSWKLSVGDWVEREFWPAYIEAYEDALSKCSTKYAPWFIVPSDRKWFRDLAVAEAVVDTLRPLRAGWMKSQNELGKVRMAELTAFREKDNES